MGQIAICAWGSLKLKGIESFDQLFTTVINSSNPTFLPSLSEISDLSCYTSCMVLPGFLMDTVYMEDSSHSTAFSEQGFPQLMDKHIGKLNGLQWNE